MHGYSMYLTGSRPSEASKPSLAGNVPLVGLRGGLDDCDVVLEMPRNSNQLVVNNIHQQEVDPARLDFGDIEFESGRRSLICCRDVHMGFGDIFNLKPT